MFPSLRVLLTLTLLVTALSPPPTSAQRAGRLSSPATPSARRGLFAKPMNRAALDAIEYGRQQMEMYEPFYLGSLVGNNNNLQVNLTNVTVMGASGFIVEDIDVNLLGLSSKIRLNFPDVHLEGNYDADGTLDDTRVTGSGPFSGKVEGIDLSGFGQFGLVRFYVQMKTAEIDYYVKNMKFTANGLKVEGMSDEQAMDLLNETLMNLLVTSKDYITKLVGDTIKGQVNQVIKGKTLVQLIGWLRSMTNPSAKLLHRTNT